MVFPGVIPSIDWVRRENACPLRHGVRGHSSAVSVFPFERGQLDGEVADGRAFG